ncbi:MAG: cysteine desulfurase [Candidatus Aenigmatarchaeota archaeon]|nr:MAG: cysteine desulfurase [Candidatus Aenigmarchaeota archaeon]
MDVEKVRKDFPVLWRELEGKKIIYFDNACTTLKPKQVIDAVRYYYENLSSCGGSRSSHDLSRETNELCEASREKVAEFIGADLSEIVWTKNTTEAVNLVANALDFNRNQKVVCSALDHHSLILPFWKLMNSKKIDDIVFVEPNKESVFDVESWKEKITPDVGMVCLTHASNVTGCETPVKEITEIAHDNEALVLLDSAQSVPHVPIDVKKLDVDFMVFSLHKMCGPTGVGVLYCNESVSDKLDTFLVGGDTIIDVEYKNNRIEPEFLPNLRRFEAGIQNYAGIIGSGAAVEYLLKLGIDEIYNYEKTLVQKLLDVLSLDELEIVGPHDFKKKVCALVSFYLKNKNISPKDVAEYLNSDVKGYKIMLRAGQHCANPFHYYIDLNPKLGEGTIRASLYFYNTREEIDIFANALKEFLKIVSGSL